MRRKVLIFSAMISVILVLPLTVSGNSIFEEDQDGANRNSLNLEGGYAEDIEVASDGTVYAGLNSPNGLFYSTDGSTWNGPSEAADFGNIIAVEVSETSAFAIGGITVYRSQDGGSSWQELDVTNAGQNMHYGGGRLFVVARDGGLAISDDDGDTFSEITIDEAYTNVNGIGAAETDDIVYALASLADETTTLFKSTDGGSTWTSTGNEIDSTTLMEIVVDPDDVNVFYIRGEENIYYSDDGGVTLSSFVTSSEVPIGDIELSGDRIYIGSYYTDDNGANWQEMETETETGNIGSDILAIDPTDSQKMYAGTSIGLAVSADGGDSWNDMNSGLYGVTVNGFVQSEDGNTAWLAANGGLGKTENFQDENPTWEFPVKTGSAGAIWIDSDDSDSLVVGIDNYIYYSTDAGDNWNAATLDSPLSGGVSDFVEVDGVLYATYIENLSEADGGVTMSSDNGLTWSDMNVSGNVPFTAIAADSDGNLYAAAGAENDTTTTKRGVYKYDGSTWSQLSGDIDDFMLEDIEVVGDAIFAVGYLSPDSGGVFRSTDSGSTWENLVSNDLVAGGWYHSLTYEPDNTDVLYTSLGNPAAAGYIYKSIDAGDSWSLYYTGLVDESFSVMLFNSSEVTASSLSRDISSSGVALGLVTGTNTGLYEMQSNAKVTLKPKKKKIKKNKKITLTARVKDYATSTNLTNKKVKLYKKVKVSKKWKLVKTKKTNKKGNAVFKVKVSKKTYFQARWKPKTRALQSSYGNDAYRSPRKTTKIKK